MVKSLVAVCVSACLLLSLSACTQDKDANTMLAGDTTEPARTLRIAAAANLSDVLPHLPKMFQVSQILKLLMPLLVSYMRKSKQGHHMIYSCLPIKIFLLNWLMKIQLVLLTKIIS
jgi:molybdate transport system substrate-binding protein